MTMPGFDGTGPRGMGPMTGGGRGFCNPAGPGYATGQASPLARMMTRLQSFLPFGYGRPVGGGLGTPVAYGRGTGFGARGGRGRGMGGGRGGRGRW